MDLLLPLIIIAIFGAGWTLHYFKARADENKRRIDELEKAQREQRLPTTVINETMDIIAIQARATRQLREVKQTISDLAAFLEAMANETERTAEKARQIRSNGQKQKGNGR